MPKGRSLQVAEMSIIIGLDQQSSGLQVRADVKKKKKKEGVGRRHNWSFT